jgi:hypothetical protein
MAGRPSMLHHRFVIRLPAQRDRFRKRVQTADVIGEDQEQPRVQHSRTPGFRRHGAWPVSETATGASALPRKARRELGNRENPVP